MIEPVADGVLPDSPWAELALDRIRTSLRYLRPDWDEDTQARLVAQIADRTFTPGG